MFKRIFTVLLLLTGFFSCVNGQSYSGPDSGGVASGAAISTDNFSKNTTIIEPREHIWNEETEFANENSEYIDFGYQTPKEGSNYFEDPNADNPTGGTPYPFLLKDFEGVPMGNSIPPDPYLAVGPDNIIAVVNTSFRIFDKEGNILKTISADSWFNNVFPNPGAFDPKVLYDVIDQRWIMVWLQQNEGSHTSSLLLSVSDDSDPLGTWYNWALPANLNGTVNANNWTDYQGVGYDQNAIYVSGNQWSFAVGGVNTFKYAKIRIIPKAQLYANTAGACSWKDIWNINNGNSFTIRPGLSYTNNSKYYLVEVPYQANFFRVFNITNPLGTPVLGLNNVPVTSYTSPGNASQLGGGMSIESGGSYLRNEPKFRDGFLYLVHSVQNPSFPQYSALHYVKINTTTNTTAQDMVFGANGYWHFYPSMDVDINGNVALAYSRSAPTEYAGAFYTGRFANDPPGFMGSQPIAKGLGNYVVTFGGDRNRWGDYTGIVLDPADQTSFWALSEYAAATNTWGTRVGKISVEPLAGPYLISAVDSIDFQNVEAGTTGDTLTIGMANYGSDDVVISTIPIDLGPFHLLNNLSFPLTLSTYDSLNLEYVFQPAAPGPYNETLTISSNSSGFQNILLKGRGYEINPAVKDNFYAVSGTVNEGSLFTINSVTGAGNLIGNADYDDVDDFKSLTIDPHTGIMYGLSNYSGNSVISRINSEFGDAYELFTLPLTEMYSITFDTSGTMYGILRTGEIYTIDLNTGSYNLQSTADVLINSASFDPETNVLYATAFVAVGSNKDRIYTIDPETGTSTIIGNTGFNILTNDLAFDPTGAMFGVTGSASQNNNFITIDKTTGTGTIIGSTNYPNITGLAYSSAGITGVVPEGNSQMPKDYSLKQNYPNPFNPSTRIEYTLPVTAGVKVVIYNLLGEVVNVLVNSQQNAGAHTVVWNSEDNHGSKVGSGVYFYELKASGSNGSDFTQIRKMILLK